MNIAHDPPSGTSVRESAKSGPTGYVIGTGGPFWSSYGILPSTFWKRTLAESEERLARLRKMESIGLLAGGVAHDLNNVLSGIVSYPDLMLLDLPDDSELKAAEDDSGIGNESGRHCSRFADDGERRGLPKEPFDLNDVIRSLLADSGT